MKLAKSLKLKKFTKQEGATMLEYGIVVALIVVGAVALLPGLGDQVTAAFQGLVDALA